MADCSLKRRTIKALRYQGLVAVADGERHKIEGFAVKSGRNRARHRADNALQIVGREHDLSRSGITDAVRRLVHSRLTNDLVNAPKLSIDCLTHVIILT